MTTYGTQPGVSVHAVCEPGSTDNRSFKLLAAKFALAGHNLTPKEADNGFTYYAGKWGLMRALPNLEAVKRFLVQVGVVA